MDSFAKHTRAGVELTVEVRVPLTVAQIAQAFCELDDDQQAQFFVECGRIVATWSPMGQLQFRAIGRHLRTCDCSTDEGRQIVVDLFEGLKDIEPS